MSFRNTHVLRAMGAFTEQNLPLDLFLNGYFRRNHSLGAKDRRAVGDTIYGLIRWLGLIDHFCGEKTWQERLKVWEERTLAEWVRDASIPLHRRACLPKELFELLVSHYGEEKAFSLSQISNGTAPTTIRINPLKITREALMQKWQGSFLFEPTIHSPYGLIFKSKTHLLSLPEFEEGFFEMQDEGSQLIAAMVEANPGEQVVDYCAGSGGKTLAFAHKLEGKGQIYLHDVRAHALAKAKQRLRRAGIENAQTSLSPRQLGKMDWVLVDAPCTGLGTLRRNPDLKWKWSREGLEELVLLQREIFSQALKYVKPKGYIVYATCSLLKEENEEQLAYFLEKFGLSVVGKVFQSLPEEGGMDGFFGVTMQVG